MKIHFIGIGGIGVSALAQYYLSKGHEVSGSDLALSEITDFLGKKGIKIFEGNEEKHIAADLDLVVHSPAVKYDNPEFRKARELGIIMKSYPEALGEITKDFYTIAVSGSHGKSTTTSMIALMMEKAGLDPTVIVGTKLKEFGNSNFRAGKGKFLVIEACEYDSSFLNYFPQIIVITNVDKEHLDYFKDFAGVKKAFNGFVERLPEGGYYIGNKEDKDIPLLRRGSAGQAHPKFECHFYSTKQKEAPKVKRALKVLGKHNWSNAMAVLEVAKILGVPDKICLKALSEFKGTWRRFEIKEGKIGKKKITIISDYAHHPNEIMATLKAAREKYPKKKIWVIFEPHQHQRTFYLFNDFVKTFRTAPIDKVIISDIYDVAGREEKQINEEVSSEKLAKSIKKKNVSYMNLADAEKFVEENVKAGEVLVIMGAGSIYKLTEKF